MGKPFIQVVGILSRNAMFQLSDVFIATELENEIVLLCRYSEFDIPTGHIFDEIIPTKEKDNNYRCRIRLKKVSQEFGIVYDQIMKGHKTICQFEFLEGKIPDIIYQLPTIEGWHQSDRSLIFTWVR